MRSIISGIGTATEKLAEVAEGELEEFVERSPSYIRDTTDFINQVKDIIDYLLIQFFSVLMFVNYTLLSQKKKDWRHVGRQWPHEQQKG